MGNYKWREGFGREGRGGVRGEPFGSVVSERQRLHCTGSYEYQYHMELNPAKATRTSVHSADCLESVL